MNFSEVTPEILALAARCDRQIPQELYSRYQVNRGLRDLQGNGVLTGLTEISEIRSKKHRCRGNRRRLYPRGTLWL